MSQTRTPQTERPGWPRPIGRWPAGTGTRAGSSWNGQPTETPETSRKFASDFKTQGSLTETEVGVHLGGALAAPREGVEEADAGRGHQQQDKDDVVHRGEVHLDHLPHGGAAFRGLGASGAGYDAEESRLPMVTFTVEQRNTRHYAIEYEDIT